MLLENGGLERPETETGTPFLQTSSSPETEETKGALSPHQLFTLFTFDIILEKKVFVR